ncbi:MAG: DUF885 domain-containing protein [Roseivirga sp.]|nr:DUF885 domain-containing protein [Roseivirga sp.]
MSQSSADRAMLNLIDRFDQQYYSFAPPALTLDFKVNLSNQLDTRRQNEQKAFFSQLLAKLGKINKEEINPDLRMDHDILSYEAQLNLERLELLANTTDHNEIEKLNRIFDFTNGPEWYAWFIKKWTGTSMSPKQVMAFGELEVERVKKRISQLDLSQPKPSSDYTQDVDLIIKTLEAKRAHIAKQIERLLPDYAALPELNIERGTNARMAQAPGYYNGNTFYFNLFDKPFDLADCDWLLIHEGNPGHHFQVNFHNDLTVKPYRSGLRYMGFVEGWAAYTENLGWELGLYKSPYEELGKWNWDLIRSVRIVLDVALNYHGWSDEKALTYWQQHIKNQDDIGMREINRMKRWPAQVLTYKMGEAAILKVLEEEKLELGKAFSYKNFHTRMLGSGIIPVALIPQLSKRPL